MLPKIALSLALLSLIPASALTHAADAPAVPKLLESHGMPYAKQAEEVTESIQQKFYLPAQGLYAHSETKRHAEFMWGNGVMFPTLVAASRHAPAKYKPIMNRFFRAMDGYWDDKAKFGGYEPAPTRGNGNDKYYDDNAWMVITFLEAYDLTANSDYLGHAQRTHAFVLSAWDEELDGGLWWHETHKGGGKNTCVNAPAAVSCFRLAQYLTGPAAAEQVAKGKQLVEWTTTKLQDKDGLYFDAIKLEGRKIDPMKWTYNTALMIRAYLGQYRETKDPADLARAVRIGNAANAFMDTKKNAYRDGFKFTHLLMEADLELYRVTGDDALLKRAIANADYAYNTWKANPPDDLIENASIARMLWLMADMQSDVGLKFWQRSDRNP